MGTSFGLLYKYTPEPSSGSHYLWRMNVPLTAIEQTELGVGIVRRYDDLSRKQALNLADGVADYRGPQHILLKMINSFLTKR